MHDSVTYLVTQMLLFAYCQNQMKVLLDSLHPVNRRAIKKEVGKWIILKYFFCTLLAKLKFSNVHSKMSSFCFNIEKCPQVNMHRKNGPFSGSAEWLSGWWIVSVFDFIYVFKTFSKCIQWIHIKIRKILFNSRFQCLQVDLH